MRNLVVIFLLGFAGCTGSDYAPKPKGYFRIEYPEKKYLSFTQPAPFTFQYPAYSAIMADSGRNSMPYWYNLAFEQFNGRLHLTYYDIASIKDYNNMVEDARNLAFKHTVKATAIDQKRINYPHHKVYGVYYEIQGNTASSVQFFLTDSTRHYLRGALYFNERPQYDSIAPVINFIKKDIDKMIETFRWKESMQPGKTRHISRLEAIQFGVNSSVMKTEAYLSLDKLSSSLRKNGDKVTLKGFASSEGAPAYNMKLSEDRANAVKIYLVNSGVKLNSVIVKGYGEANSVASNDTEKGRIQNRRVETSRM